jgi:hypothetical protein
MLKRIDIWSAAMKLHHDKHAMSTHRYKIGQRVRLSLGIFHPDKSLLCEVVQLLPFEGTCLQYRVKSSAEAFHRVANEHDLALVDHPPGAKVN